MLLTGCSGNKTGETTSEEAQPTVSLATLIRMQSRLYTSEYIVHKIVTHNDLKRLQGSFLGFKFNQSLPIGDRKIAIPIDVTLQAYIDFSQIRDEDVEIIKSEKKNVRGEKRKVMSEKDDTPSLEGREDDIVHITLPDPRVVVTSSKVDHEGIRTHVGLLRSDFKDAELTNLAQQGAASVVQNVPRMGIIESARQNAAALLIPMLADMGYREENIVITFRKDFDDSDISTLFDNEGSRVKIGVRK